MAATRSALSQAPTVFGSTFGYTLRHDQAAQRITIDIPAPLTSVRYIYPCRLATRSARWTGCLPQRSGQTFSYRRVPATLRSAIPGLGAVPLAARSRDYLDLSREVDVFRLDFRQLSFYQYHAGLATPHLRRLQRSLLSWHATFPFTFQI